MRLAVCLTVALTSAGCGRLGFDAMQANRTADSGSGALPAWSLVNVQGTVNDSGPTTLSVSEPSPITAGDLVVVALHARGNASSIAVTDNAPGGGTTYTAIPGAIATNTTLGDTVEIWYAPSASAGVTSITASSSTGQLLTLMVWEFATRAPATVDTAAELSAQPSTLAPSAPPVTTANTGELVIAIAIVAGNVLGIAPEFTDDSQLDGNGWAHIRSPAAPAGMQVVQWDSDAGSYCADAVAFHVGE
jgi:hypothetical protein